MTAQRREVPGGGIELRRKLYTDVDWSRQQVYDADRWCLPTDNVDVAELVSSEVGHGIHMPVLDLDVPHHVVASTTPGHSHLYVDVPMTWQQYKRLLTTLASVGVIEPGYAAISLARGRTEVRVPWLRKQA